MAERISSGRSNATSAPETARIGTGIIVTKDAGISTLVSEALESVAIGSDSCDGAASCSARISRNRYEVAFVDFNLGDEATTAIENIRSAPSTRTSVVIAITANSEQSNEANSCGAHFNIQQPITRSAVDSILRAAYGLIIRERRRYFRCPIDATVVAHRRTESAWVGRGANVSEGGLCIVTDVSLSPGELVEIEFTLPSSSIEISADCEVQWSDGKGRVGLQFIQMHHDSKIDLQHWLTDQLDALLKPTLSRLAPMVGAYAPPAVAPL